MKKSWAILILILVSLQSCSTSTKDELIGHWHKVPTGDWTYQTIDIEDTVTITDKYSLSGGSYLRYPRSDKNGQQILPTDFFKHSAAFLIDKDTLTIRDSLRVYQYVKSDLRDCIFSDRYSNCHIRISINVSDIAENYDASYEQFCSEELFIGKLIPNSGFKDSLSSAFPDSIFIQSRDILVRLSDIAKICDQARNICTEANHPMNINLHADVNVSGKFIKQIESMIPADFSIHRIAKIDGRDIGLVKIK